jgi:hypothetical protein
MLLCESQLEHLLRKEFDMLLKLHFLVIVSKNEYLWRNDRLAASVFWAWKKVHRPLFVFTISVFLIGQFSTTKIWIVNDKFAHLWCVLIAKTTISSSQTRKRRTGCYVEHWRKPWHFYSSNGVWTRNFLWNSSTYFKKT